MFDPTIPEELATICDRSMAKLRYARFQTVNELKTAVLDFQIHKQSIDLATTAVERLGMAQQSKDYQDFTRALFGFEEALHQWPANVRAAAGIAVTRLDYAQAAYERGDFDLALSLLTSSPTDDSRADISRELPAAGRDDEEDEGTAFLRTQIQHAVAERDARRRRIRRLRIFAISVCLLAAIATTAAVWRELNDHRFPRGILETAPPQPAVPALPAQIPAS
jgi:hypothetical protein